jgi:WD40 repeat protein/serine/threonine protein kinase
METIPAVGSDSGSGNFDADEDSPSDWRTGDVILDMYEVRGVLGEGGMGRVFSVYHRQWDTMLAVKSPLASFFSDRRCAQAFQKECENWVQLGLHPHVATCYYVRTLGGVPRIFAELVPGGTLQDAIDGNVFRGLDGGLAHILTIGIQLAWGLSFAHKQGLMHTDMKPGNVLLTEDGAAKVTDFGLARARASIDELTGKSETTVGSISGMTPGYCSPEQALCRKLTPATDIWSWALCVFEAVCGEKRWKYGPQASETLATHRAKGTCGSQFPNVPKSLIELLVRCCQDDPNARPRDILEAADELAEVYLHVTGEPFPQHKPEDVTHQPEYMNNRAISLIDLGKRDQAVEQWEHALEIAPGHADSAYNLGLAQWRRGDLSDAELLERLEHIRTSDRGAGLVTAMLPSIHSERGDYRQALTCLDALGDARVRDRLRSLRNFLVAKLKFSRGEVRSVEAHSDRINSIKISRNGRYALSGSEDNTIKLWDLNSGRCVRELVGHRHSVLSVYLSRKGEYALSGSTDRTVRLWSVETLECLKTMRGHEGVVTSVALSMERDLIVSGSEDSTIRLWRKDSGACDVTLRGHSGWVTCLTLHPNLAAISSAGDDGTIRIWDPGSTQSSVSIRAHDGSITDVRWSGCGRYLASSGVDGTIKIWDVGRQNCLRTLRIRNGHALSVAFSPDSSLLVSGGTDSTICTWECDTGRCVCTMEGHGGPIASVDIDGSGTTIVTSDERGTIRVWRLGETFQERTAPLVLSRTVRSEDAVTTQRAFQNALKQAEASISRMDTASAREAIERARALPGYERSREAMQISNRLYSLIPRESIVGYWEIADAPLHSSSVNCIETWGDGHRILSGGADGQLVVWNVSTQQIETVFEGHEGGITCACVDSQGRVAVSAGEDNTVRVWETQTGKCLRVIGQGLGLAHVEAICMSPNPRFVVTGGMDLRLCDLTTGRLLQTFSGPPVEGDCLQWTPDGTYIVAGSSDGSIRVYEPGVPESVRMLTGGRGKFRAISISGDGKTMVSVRRHLWSPSAEIRMWNINTWECVREFEGDIGAVSKIAISFDGTYALTVDDTGMAKIWDVRDGSIVAALITKGGPLTSASFTRNGSHALAGSESGRVWLWQIDWEFSSQTPLDRVEAQLSIFLESHVPYADELPLDRAATPDEVAQALSRRGKPNWTPAGLRALGIDLGCAGAGHIPMERLEAVLTRAAQMWGTSRHPQDGWLKKIIGGA